MIIYFHALLSYGVYQNAVQDLYVHQNVLLAVLVARSQMRFTFISVVVHLLRCFMALQWSEAKCTEFETEMNILDTNDDFDR